MLALLLHIDLIAVKDIIIIVIIFRSSSLWSVVRLWPLRVGNNSWFLGTMLALLLLIIIFMIIIVTVTFINFPALASIQLVGNYGWFLAKMLALLLLIIVIIIVTVIFINFSAIASALVGNYGWFVGTMLVLLLLIGLTIFFTILFKRGARLKPRDSPSNSFYGGDAGSKSGTYPDSKLFIFHLPPFRFLRSASPFGLLCGLSLFLWTR